MEAEVLRFGSDTAFENWNGVSEKETGPHPAKLY